MNSAANPPAASANIARHLGLMAASQPVLAALKIPRGRTGDGRIDYLTLTFAELASEVGAWRSHLETRGVRRGDRVLVMVRQGLPLIAAAFALFQLGAVPVVIDPGMGRKNFLACVARSKPRVLLGIPLARLLSHVFRKAFKTVEVRVAASGSPTARRGRTARAETAAACVEPVPGELAAILFTSGSTGAPKGVCYTHEMFDAQVRLIRDAYDIRPGEIDLPLLPVFALFNPALGVTTIVPELDPARPAAADPEKLVRAILQENVTTSFGSPTLWRKLALHCEDQSLTLPTMRRVLSAGAPVPPDLWQRLAAILPNGTAHSPYGATEALPVSSISAAEVIGETAFATQRGAGTCVGRPLAANRVKIIAFTPGPVASLADTRELPSGEIGELIVAGPTVTHAYDALPAATAAAKIFENTSGATGSASDARDVTVWHRLGDAGYLDASGRLWFCGRLAERVETDRGVLFTEQVEPLFNAHSGVRRSALVGLGTPGNQRAVLIVEPISGSVTGPGGARRQFARELREIALRHPHTAGIRWFYFHPQFPVDVRHNAKIHRLTLARWAATAIGYESDPKR